MKLRTRLVANSSSATYIVSIETTPDKYLELLYSALEYPYYFKAQLIENLEKRLIDQKKYLKHSESGKIDILVEAYKTNINELESDIAALLSMDDTYASPEKKELLAEYTEILFRNQGATIDVHNDGITIKGHTSMHNSYDDMPQILKELVIFMNFEMPNIKITCEKEED